MSKVNLPRPAGWRVIVEVKEIENKTKGGVYLPDQSVDVMRYGAATGVVRAMGDLAYKDENKFGAGGPWCKVGDTVVIAKHSGWRFKQDGKDFKVLNDDEIIAVVDPGSEITT